MQEDFETIQNIFLSLLYHYRNQLKGGLPAYQDMFPEFPPMHENQDLGNLMSDLTTFESHFDKSEKFFYLPRMDRDPHIVPILIFDCNLSKSVTDVSFIIILSRQIDDPKKPERIAFRFEGPEGTSENKSEHNYWHIQLTNEIDVKKGFQKITCLKWLPTKMPCIPVVGRCPVSLLLCLLFSFYGRQMFKYINKSKIKEEYYTDLKPIIESCA
jgi:hypothetical protein